jgi:tRNA threonylcarbamoyladenosine biosynthesis protein TsaE
LLHSFKYLTTVFVTIYICSMEVVYQIGDINKAAELVWTNAGGKTVLAFSGEMGSGKTTFIHALCEHLGVKGTIGSPTFSIINEYAYGTGIIYHIDLYRCKNEEEAIRAGVEDCLYSGQLCLVEWPSRAEGLLPEDTVRISINEIDHLTRHITISV